MNKCQCCQAKTENPKFCSKSCSAKMNNKLFPKRSVEPQNLCLNCNKRCSRTSGQRKTQLCKKCFFREQVLNYGKKTKKQSIDETVSWAAKHRYEKIRQHAKRLSTIFSWKPTSCEICGYEDHTELCHIKPIHKFSDKTLLDTINDRKNIKFLCPNCHWELDHKNKTRAAGVEPA